MLLKQVILKPSPVILILLTFLLSNKANSLTTETLKGSLIGALSANSFSMAPVGANQQQTTPAEIEHFLTITGTASRTVITDLILIGLNVETLDISLGTSYRENTQASNELSKVFKELNIPDRNITTTSYDTTKKYRSVWVPYNSTWGQIFEGYLVSNKMEVRLSDVKKVSDLIERALAIGSVLVTSISFDYSRVLQKKLKDTLLPLAAEDAVNRAKISAQALRVVIDDVKSANVEDITPFPVNARNQQQQQNIAYAIQAESQTAPQIFAGRTKVDVNVYVNFIIMKE